ncbi:hypothetical protein IFM89_027238 [Coptis chinensis]|uniref:Uncharacterized protein n=1 Tax=Coptis chinensis TaxID=261450 RepID=A0A835LZV9_9MAGN|nr:hypothetical protein IFM89_027238 [Coptis chinensis]
MEKSFEEFEPIYGKVNAEWEQNSNSNNIPLLQFLYHVHALDSKHLRIHVTDFHSCTWESVKSIQQLEDLKDYIGVGGSWSDFINYLMDSIKSANVKLVVSTNSGVGHGAKFAKLIAHKTKGTPVITISLDRLMNSSANDAVAIISWQIFEASRSRHDLLVKGCTFCFSLIHKSRQYCHFCLNSKHLACVFQMVLVTLDEVIRCRCHNSRTDMQQEQQRSYELTVKLFAEKEKNEIIKDQLTRALSSKEQKLLEFTVSEKDQLSLALSSKKQKLSEFTVSDRLSPIASPLINLDTTTVCGATSSLDEPSSQGSLSMKFSSHVVPAYRRQHASGILLDDSEDDGW